jgi:GR25 family glycosyltransferase involved in LPS biosynthesis
MKAFIISMVNNSQSQLSTEKVLKSIEQTRTKVTPNVFPATTPETIIDDIKSSFGESYVNAFLTSNKRDVNYTWPKTAAEDRIDFSTGIYRRAYAAADWRKVAACSVSHMRLWQHGINIDEPIMILEHDAIFLRSFDYKDLEDQWNGGVCGLNDPRGTTRKARIYDQKVREVSGLCTVPYVDDPSDIPLPSGLAGNSAYIIKPWAAKKLLDKMVEVGIWPNDALMCRQFFPWLQQYFPYLTTVQGTPSTTTR